MNRTVIVVGALVVIAGAGTYYVKQGAGPQANVANGGGRGGAPGGGGPGGPFGGFGGPGGARLPMTVEVASVKRADMSTTITVVGNLIGAATVEALPKVAGRLESVSVRLGDRVTRGQTIAKIEDQEIQQQVKQQKAAYDVAAATIRQRQAGLQQAQANLDRSRNLFERQLIPKQTFDDVDATYQAAAALLDLANAQFAQAKARLDELQINLENTVISSPVSGFVGKRALDPGAWVTTNSSFVSVVDIGVVRLVANIVEKELRRITTGLNADVEVDAYPGEKFSGKVGHVSPVLDPATRTGQIEVDIVNPQFRLKPGMYAKVTFIVDKRDQVLVIPLTALADVGGNRGVFTAAQGKQGNVAHFKQIEVGLMDRDLVEVSRGLSEGDQIVSTGAGALRDGDRVLLQGQGEEGGGAPESGNGGGGRGRGREGGGRRGQAGQGEGRRGQGGGV
jgi:RND family efflux transporter MFP subunit